MEEDDKALLLHGEAYPVWIASKARATNVRGRFENSAEVADGSPDGRWSTPRALASQSTRKGDFLLEARCTQVSATT